MEKNTEIKTSFIDIENLLRLASTSENDFLKTFTQLGQSDGLQVYIQILSEMEKAVAGGDVSNFKAMSEAVQWIHSATPASSNSHADSPLSDTSFVIIACKYNSFEIVKYLLGNGNWISQNTMPEKLDDEGHNVIYYAIRSSNVTLLETIINEWPGGYFANHPEKTERILSAAYDELMLRRVLLSDEMKFFVQNKLLSLRFFCKVETAKTSPSNIVERIELVLEKITTLTAEYSLAGVDEKFIYIATFVAQNIHILKQQLKSTYAGLPWEEMEFCLVFFISAHTRRQELNIFFRSVLNKGDILENLGYFSKSLTAKIEHIRCTDISSLRRPINSTITRDKVIADILKQNSCFNSLYNSYKEVRDIYSLQVMKRYIDAALLADCGTREGQLTVKRALQVMGEHLKNSVESPKLSGDVSKLLLLSAPAETRKLLTDLRNSLSKTHFPPNDKAEEECKFYAKLQNDINKVGDVITDLLLSKKIEKIQSTMVKIIESNSLDEENEILETFKDISPDAPIQRNQISKKNQQISDIIREINNIIVNKTNHEVKLFEQINEIINKSKNNSKNLVDDYTLGFMMVDFFRLFKDKKILRNKTLSNVFKEKKSITKEVPVKLLVKSKPLESKTKKLVTILFKLYDSVVPRVSPETRDRIHLLISQVTQIYASENDNLMWMDEFRERLRRYKSNKSNTRNNNTNKIQCDIPEDQHVNQFKKKLSDLGDIISAFKLGNKLRKKLSVCEHNQKTKFTIEMIILDIMSFLDSSNRLSNNTLFLDDSAPLLSGKSLRNHLAHGNALFDLLFPDIFITLLSNANSLAENVILNSSAKIGNFVTHDLDKLKQKYDGDLQIISRQEELSSALRQGNLEDLKRCLKGGADTFSTNNNLWTSFHMAAQGTNLEIIKFLLKRKVATEERNIVGQVPLHVAATFGRADIVEFLINEINSPINAIDNLGKTPLHLAAQNGHQETVVKLLSLGASHTAKDSGGYSPVHWAITDNHINVVNVLLKKEVNVDANKLNNNVTCLHLAALLGHVELVNYFLHNNADVNAKALDGTRPLHFAALNGHLEVVNALINKGAQVNPISHETGCTPLHYAVIKSHEDIVKIILEHGAFVNTDNRTNNRTPLHEAANNGHKSIVELLIKYKANVNAVQDDGTTPLMCAAANGHLEVVNLLILGGCWKDTTNDNGETALHLSIMHGHNDIVKFLIESGFDIHIGDKSHVTPLHLAAYCDNQVAVDILLAVGADVKSLTEDLLTPLHMSAYKGNEEISEALIKMGAPINAENVDDFTPLHLAVFWCDNENIINILIKYGADVNRKRVDNVTPLHDACFFGHNKVVNVLIKNNATVDSKISSGLTPLDLATQQNHKAVVEILVKLETFTSETLSTVLCHAVSHNYGDLVKILIEKGADVNTESGKPLKLAISTGYRGIVEALLKNKDIDIDVNNHNGSTLLNLAADSGNWNIGKALIKKYPETSKITPLVTAIRKGHKEFVDMLILNGADVNAVLPENISLLHIAISEDHPDIVETLLSSGANHNIRHAQKGTPFELAVGKSLLHIVKKIFKNRNININERGNGNWTVLHIAAHYGGSLECVQFLVKNGADVNAKNTSGVKPIHFAAREGFLKIVEFFIEFGMSISDEGEFGNTLVHYATARGQAAVVRYLIGKQIDINAVNLNGIQPIHLAAGEGQLEVLNILLQHGAIYDSKNYVDKKPVQLSKNKDISKILVSIENLFEAVKKNDVSNIEVLINNGALLNARNKNKSTLLHFACWKGYAQACDILLENKANPDITAKNGNTPLHYAAKYSHFKIVQSLLKNSAKYDIMTDNGTTPLDFATEKNIVYLLKLVERSFRKVKNGDVRVIDDLAKIKDIDNIKAIMKACNEDGKCLIVVGIDNNFPNVETLKEILQDNRLSLKAAAMYEEKRFSETLCVLEDILNERREILGEDNPGTLDIQERIAHVLSKQSKDLESLELHVEVYHKRLEKLGPNNCDSLRSKRFLTISLKNQGRHQEALDILLDIYQKQKDILGDNHPDILSTRLDIGASFRILGMYEEALNMNYENYEKCLEILVDKNPFTLQVRDEIGMALIHLERYDEALLIYQEVYEARKLLLGPNHSDTLRTVHNRAIVLAKQQNFDEALKILLEVLAIQKNILGSKHCDTVYTQINIGKLYLSQNKKIDAIRLFKAEGDQMKTTLGTDHPKYLSFDMMIQACDKWAKIEKYDINEFYSCCQPAIITAASEGNIVMLESLIQKGSDVDTADAQGRTPLHFAIDNRHTNVVKMLLKRGVDATAVTTKGNTPLHTAASQDCVNISELLLHNVRETKQLRFNDFINAKTVVGGTSALHVACKKGSIKMTKCLLKYGACYNLADRAHNSIPLQYSQSPDVTYLLQLIRECFLCVKKGDTKIIDKLLALEADDLEAVLNARDENLQTPLQVAIVSKHTSMTSSLAGILRAKNR